VTTLLGLYQKRGREPPLTLWSRQGEGGLQANWFISKQRSVRGFYADLAWPTWGELFRPESHGRGRQGAGAIICGRSQKKTERGHRPRNGRKCRFKGKLSTRKDSWFSEKQRGNYIALVRLHQGKRENANRKAGRVMAILFCAGMGGCGNRTHLFRNEVGVCT